MPGGRIDESRTFVPISVGVLTVSDTRTAATDTSGDAIVRHLEAAGHQIGAREIVVDEQPLVSAQFGAWITDPAIDVVIATGGTGVTRRDITVEALEPHVTKLIPGFGELFRWLSYDEIGTSTVQSRAMGALCNDTYVFLLPGSTGAVTLGMSKILIPQLDARHRPCNFVELLPRIRAAK
jgi:molybdenum cofactor biosynthesis protein B